jgi:hypothetical protein
MSEREKPVDHHDNTVFARRYDELAPLFLDYVRARRKFKALVRKDQFSLEIGMGSGLFALPLIAQGYRIDGLEPNVAMVAALAQNTRAQGLQIPKVEQSSVLDFTFDTPHPIIYSHSGPMFVTRESGQLYYEGLNIPGDREAEAAGNAELIQRILRRVVANNGKFLLNIQENRSGIRLSDGSTFNLNPVGNGYDPKNLEVTKQYRFVERDGSVLPSGGEGTYRRFACTLDQLNDFVKRAGDFDIRDYKDTWLVISPKDQTSRGR